jgi:FdhD protein
VPTVDGIQSVQIVRFAGLEPARADDGVAVEEPLEIRLGAWYKGQRLYKSVSVTMRTPGHDFELALGFLCGEGILAGPAEVETIAHWGPIASDGGHRNVITVDLKPGVEVDFTRLERHFYTTSSCGVCGKASLDAVRVNVRHTAPQPRNRVPLETIYRLPQTLAAAQPVFRSTGGLHAAALFDWSGQLACVREDVGRHNAVDKVIGATLAGGHALAEHILLLSGRAGFELIQKAAVAGIPLIAAIGAPSSLAVDLAREFHITLIGFLRDQRCNIYSEPERIEGAEGSLE